MLNNPIFVREIKGAVRDPKVCILIVGFVVLLSGILLFLWPTSGVFSLASDSSMEIFSLFLMSNLALIILLVPALTSTSITTERENKSYDLLFTSLLTPGEILRGKLFAAITMIILVIAVSMPVAALCSLSGGISPGLLYRAYLVITLSAFTYGMLGLAVSALCRRTMTALIFTYVGVTAMAGCTWLPYFLLGRLYFLKDIWQFMRSLSPFDALYSLIFPERYALSQLSQISDHHLFPFYSHVIGMIIFMAIFFAVFCKFVLTAPKPGVIYSWVSKLLIVLFIPILGIEAYVNHAVFTSPEFSVVYGNPLKIVLISVAVDMLLLMVIRNLRRMAKSEGSQYEDQFADTRTRIKRKLTWPFYLIDPLRRKKPIGRFRNPVYIAEMRSKIFGKPKFIIRGLATCIIASLVLLTLVAVQYATFLRPDTVRWVAVIFQIGLISILAPAISSGSITDEITSHTMLMLRMTPLSALKVVLGKLKASFVYVSIFLVSSLPVLFALAFLEAEENYWRVGAWCVILILTTVTLITAGLCASAFAKSTSSATGISYCFSGLICIVTFAALLPGAFAPMTRQIILTLNPMVAALRITSDRLFSDMPPNLWIHNMAFLAGTAVFFILAAAVRIYVLFTRRT